MATSAPPLPAPAATGRARDWPRTSEGSAFTGIGRGRGGGGGGGGGGSGGRGRNRGGRSRGGGGGPGGGPGASSTGPASTSRAPSVPAPTAPAKPSTTDAPKTPAPAPASASGPPPEQKSATPRRPKGHGRKASQPTVPTVVVDSSNPPSETATASSRPSNRRRRSQQLPKGSASAAGLKVTVSSADDNMLRPQNRLLVPHSAPPPSKDTPPHLAGTFDMRSNIDALVERVRAVAMDNRPSTPGSHIDWAGDDDEGLPDLDDWGVKTSVDKKDEMISPIIVDGLTPLPDPVAPAPSGGAIKEAAASSLVTDRPSQKASEGVHAPLHPSLPSKPITNSTVTTPQRGRSNNAVQRSPLRTAITLTNASVAQEPSESLSSEPPKPSVQPGPDSAAQQDEIDPSDAAREGLAASIHASSVPHSASAPNIETRSFSPTHQRAHTVGRNFPQSAPVNFNSRFSRSGASTPRGGYSSGAQHARTQSSPPAGSMLNNHRVPHSRPVITGDAISRLARTIAAPSRNSPVSTSSNS